MYESTLAGAFFYLWGAHDYQQRRVGRNAIVLNAQNPLDNLLGDLVGKTDSGRWFIAELKRLESGFPQELIAKPHRANFLNWLASSTIDSQVSSRAHFAVWAHNNDFRVSEYAATADPALFAPTPTNLMRAVAIGFRDFYDEVNIRTRSKHPVCSQILSHGLGVPGPAMVNYIMNLIRHHKDSIDAQEESLLIFANIPPSGPAKFFCGSSFNGLWLELEHMRNLSAKNRPAP
ncbi:hypothetical protein ACNJRW_04165 [Stenotrophomonas maltophilia]|nr:hypothetical protein [Stenotrophomonas maltophilia]